MRNTKKELEEIRKRQLTKLFEQEKLIGAMNHKNIWYKNCKNLRKRHGKICQVCPFREMIENIEKLEEPKPFTRK